eukprot:1489961-Pleurochrysis_carterae.AAC.2
MRVNVGKQNDLCNNWWTRKTCIVEAVACCAPMRIQAGDAASLRRRCRGGRSRRRARWEKRLRAETKFDKFISGQYPRRCAEACMSTCDALVAKAFAEYGTFSMHERLYHLKICFAAALFPEA